jgi:D-alanine--poly(phosphoribitol) ligase subunit 1
VPKTGPYALVQQSVESVNPNILAAFYNHALTYPGRLALVIGTDSYSYEKLAGVSQEVSHRLDRRSRVGILASRTLEAYAGVLGTLWSGAAYIPINPALPEERLIQLLRITELDALVTDRAGSQRIQGRVAEVAPEVIVSHSEFIFRSFDRHYQPANVSETDLAYIMFTSGTTGVPKGVMIETGSVAQLIHVMQDRFRFHENDRMSQTFELTFDLSVFDMFMTWSSGAALFVVPASQLMAPGRFIKDNQLTVWFCVPSMALFMQRMRMLKAGAFPSLRYSLFCGEALPLAAAQAWQAAAPHSIVENLYGPTEATVMCTGQRLTEIPNSTPNRGTLAIGYPFDGVEVDIVNSSLRPVAECESGELLLSGRQLARGYWNDPEMTAIKFPILNGKRWYRTGDLAYRDGSGALHHLGRLDNQVKVLGHRVELEEVEAHLRAITGTDSVVALAWPIEDGCAKGIVAFVSGNRLDENAAREAMRQRIPSYMVPRRILEIDSMPLGPSGKFDRKALSLRLEQASGKVGL